MLFKRNIYIAIISLPWKYKTRKIQKVTYFHRKYQKSVLSCKYCKIFKNTYFGEYLAMTAFVGKNY